MKIVKRIGDFVIKETNESERSGNRSFFDKARSNMENFYIYHKDHSATKYVDDYIDTADTLEEAVEIAEREVTKTRFRIDGYAKGMVLKTHKISARQECNDVGTLIVEAILEGLEYLIKKGIECKVEQRINHLNNSYEFMVDFDFSPYQSLTTLVFTAYDIKEDENDFTFKLKLLGAYDKRF